MKYIYLIAAFNAFFFTVLLLQKKKALHDKILIAWLVYLGLYTGTYALVADSLFTTYHLLSASFVSLLLLHGPFLYFYISALTRHNFRFGKGSAGHLIPFILFNAYLFVAWLQPEVSAGIRLDHVETENDVPVLLNLFLILTVLSGPAYFLLAIRLFRKFNSTLSQNFSTPDNINPVWLKTLVYVFGMVWTILIIGAALHHVFHFYTLRFCTDSLFLSLAVLIILIGYFGLKQQQIFTPATDAGKEYVEHAEPKYTARLLEDEEADRLINRLQLFMDTHKPWRDSNLSLPDLAEKLEVPSHHLSRVINEKLGLNFFEFINKYRVDEVKANLIDPSYQNLSVLGIAFDSGFNSKSAFNRVFKKFTGTTPSAYKKEMSGE